MKFEHKGYQVECSVEEFAELTNIPQQKQVVTKTYKSQKLNYNNQYWSEEDIKILKEYYGDKKNLGPKGNRMKKKAIKKLMRLLRRPANIICKKALRIGLTTRYKK